MFFSDHPWHPVGNTRDAFEFEKQLRFVLELILDKSTPTPLSIAICGSWGSGKTSAMNWLTHEVREQSDYECLWFYPWKYQTREEVLRGLLAEVILACTRVDGKITRKRMMAALSQFGSFLGDLLLPALTQAAAEVSGWGKIGLKKELTKSYERHIKPHKLYLNHFETAFAKWVNASLKGDKLLIFVDDLDRCLPDVAIEVLEAVKQYIHQPGVAFIFGVDRNLINRFVVHRYRNHGVDERDSDGYVGKIFQLELSIQPSEYAVKEFAKNLLDNMLTSLQEQYTVSQPDREFLEIALVCVAGLSPREIKRVLNGILITGRSAPELDFVDLAHAYLVFEYLFRRHQELSRDFGLSFFQEFLRDWSAAIREYPTEGFISDELRENLGQISDTNIEKFEPGDGTLPSTNPEAIRFTKKYIDEDSRLLRLLTDREFPKLLSREYKNDAVNLVKQGKLARVQEIGQAIFDQPHRTKKRKKKRK